MKRILALLLSLLLLVPVLTACGGGGLQDGYYTAQAAEFSHGWKEYITIMVKGGSIVSVEYNAENASGFIKSWDNAYMQTMLHSNGTYPNEYTRYYANQLLEGQGEGSIDALSGASSSHGSFQLLAKAVLEQARLGDSSIVFVDTDAHEPVSTPISSYDKSAGSLQRGSRRSFMGVCPPQGKRQFQAEARPSSGRISPPLRPGTCGTCAHRPRCPRGP